MYRLLFLALGLTACDSQTQPVGAPDCEPALASTVARIVWGEGADGVEIGDSEAAVRSTLGEPDGTALIDVPTAEAGLSWANGPHAGVTVVFVSRPDGPADAGVVRLDRPYTGRAASGVGIGATRAEVACAYGPAAQGSESLVRYDAGDVAHLVAFAADTVRSIEMWDRTVLD